MRQDDPINQLSNVLNTPGKAMAVLLALATFGAGYYIGRHGMPAGLAAPGSSVPAAQQDNISVHFSPKGGCTETVVRELNAAQQTVFVQAYSFTSKDIAAALTAAVGRGARVTVIIDSKELDQYSKASQVAAGGVTVFVDAQHPIAHNKIMLIDGRTIITGSFNFTAQAENGNAENLLVMHDKAQLFDAYQRNFEEHKAHSTPFSPGDVKESHRGK